MTATSRRSLASSHLAVHRPSEASTLGPYTRRVPNRRPIKMRDFDLGVYFFPFLLCSFYSHKQSIVQAQAVTRRQHWRSQRVSSTALPSTASVPLPTSRVMMMIDQESKPEAPPCRPAEHEEQCSSSCQPFRDRTEACNHSISTTRLLPANSDNVRSGPILTPSIIHQRRALESLDSRQHYDQQCRSTYSICVPLNFVQYAETCSHVAVCLPCAPRMARNTIAAL